MSRFYIFNLMVMHLYTAFSIHIYSNAVYISHQHIILKVKFFMNILFFLFPSDLPHN